MVDDEPVQAAIRLADESDAYALSDWFNRAGHFRGLVDVTSQPPDPGETAPIVYVVTVAVSGGGMMALLISKIYDWIPLRHGRRSLTVTYTCPGGRRLEIEVDRAQERAQLLDSVRRMVESGDDA